MEEMRTIRPDLEAGVNPIKETSSENYSIALVLFDCLPFQLMLVYKHGLR
jgi:hypothetical protein